MLRGFLDKTSSLTQLNQAVLKKCDPSLRAHCRVSNVRDGILILAATTPAFGHTLRFSETDILTALRQDPNWSQLKSIQALVRPELTSVRNPEPPFPPPRLSAGSRATIRQSAEGIQSPKLRRALLQLGSR